MGWSSISLEEVGSKKAGDVKQFLKRYYEIGGAHRVIDTSKKGNVVYMALEYIRKKEVYAHVVLISFEEGELSWKKMCETSGPCAHDCPKRILDKLSPTEDTYANNWRQTCRETIAKRNVSYQHGDILSFPNLIEFTDGTHGNQFILVKTGRRTSFCHYRGQTELNKIYGMYSIRNWKLAEPKVVGTLS